MYLNQAAPINPEVVRSSLLTRTRGKIFREKTQKESK